MSRDYRLSSNRSRSTQPVSEDWVHRSLARHSDDRGIADAIDAEIAFRGLSDTSFVMPLEQGFVLERSAASEAKPAYTRIFLLYADGVQSLPLYERVGVEDPLILQTTGYNYAVSRLLRGDYAVSEERPNTSLNLVEHSARIKHSTK